MCKNKQFHRDFIEKTPYGHGGGSKYGPYIMGRVNSVDIKFLILNFKFAVLGRKS